MIDNSEVSNVEETEEDAVVEIQAEAEIESEEEEAEFEEDEPSENMEEEAEEEGEGRSSAAPPSNAATTNPTVISARQLTSCNALM